MDDFEATITVNQIVMIPSASYHLAAGNFQLADKHPPLARIIERAGALATRGAVAAALYCSLQQPVRFQDEW